MNPLSNVSQTQDTAIFSIIYPEFWKEYGDYLPHRLLEQTCKYFGEYGRQQEIKLITKIVKKYQKEKLIETTALKCIRLNPNISAQVLDFFRN